jgi:hypothetical protein
MIPPFSMPGKRLVMGGRMPVGDDFLAARKLDGAGPVVRVSAAETDVVRREGRLQAVALDRS